MTYKHRKWQLLPESPPSSCRFVRTTTLFILVLTLSFNCQANKPEYSVERPMEIQEKLNAAYLAKGIQYKPRTEHLHPDGTPQYINRLILEDSPYLLQHAHNPVDWYPWGEEAFARAKRENKAVFLSIGYSTCHWCHVMERESFENPAIAKLLNEHFISIKVDRESHPDVDEVYMTAVMLLTGQGGWPMSSFLTPDGKPFYAGTYYPLKPFGSLLMQIKELWQERRDELMQQADRVAEAVDQANSRRGQAKALDVDIVSKAVKSMERSFDDIQGGFSQAPKFPHEPWLFLLLDQAERRDDPRALEMLETTLDHMARGGIYDQVGGGFHRYSTDYEWLVPHFEKMLYNQAHLARVYLGAWRLTGKEQYRRIVTQTLDYVLREMTAPEGGVYSATDADSEGEEGLFFTWTPKEIRDILSSEDAQLVLELYDITQAGNFEGRNILHLPEGLEVFAERKKLDVVALRKQIDSINASLWQHREHREPPLRDDKIVTSWNGMVISAFAQAADLLGSADYRQAAEKAGEFLWRHNRPSEGALWRVHLDGKSSINANQEDYAYLAEGYLYLYDLTSEAKWLERSRELADAMLKRFQDKDGGFYMNEGEDEVFTGMSRPRDGGTDNAIPSGSSVALHVLQMLSERTDKHDYKVAADALITYFAGNIGQQPNGYGYLLTALENLNHGALTARQYAANGGIRLQGRLQVLDEKKQLLNVEINIPQGWHINSHQPKSADLIPTELRLSDGASGWQLAPVTYPQESTQKLAFQSEPLSVYTGRIQLQALVERAPTADNRLMLPVELSLQACNNEVCLPPEQLTLRIHPTAP